MSLDKWKLTHIAPQNEQFWELCLEKKLTSKEDDQHYSSLMFNIQRSVEEKDGHWGTKYKWSHFKLKRKWIIQ